jgi:hypothetical protein
MDAREAREHLEMVDRILSRAEPPKNYRPWSWVLVIIGTAAALIEAGYQVSMGGHGDGVVYAGFALMAAGYAYMIWSSYAARRNAERVPDAEARIGKACGAVWLAVFIAFFAQPHIFNNFAVGAIWNIGGAIQMLMFGFFGDRKSLFGGLILAFSILAANYVSTPGYALAGGFILGYVVPGAMNIFASSETEERE